MMRNLRRFLLMTGLAGFLITQTGCVSYTQIQPTHVGDYEEIRITWPTGDKENLWYPHTAADTLVGIRASGDTLRTSLERIDVISVGRTDWAKTGGLLAGLSVIGFAVFAIGMSGYCGIQC
jgi:hypothetical protein